MALKPNKCGRLNLQELNDYRDNSGLTDRQYQILKRRFFDKDEPSIQKICFELHIGTTTYNKEMKKALEIIDTYRNKNN